MKGTYWNLLIPAGMLCLLAVSPVNAQLPPPETADLTPSSSTSEGSFTTQTYDGRTVWVTTNPANMPNKMVPTTTKKGSKNGGFRPEINA